MKLTPIKPPPTKHPSGRPIRREKKPGYADGYRNHDGPKTWRLRAGNSVNAIGFTADLWKESDE